MNITEFCELLCENEALAAIAEETVYWWVPVIGATIVSECLPFLGPPHRANGLLHWIVTGCFRMTVKQEKEAEQ